MYSKIEILRVNFFTTEFKNITYLDLSSNGIQQVFNAFQNLPELRWIVLANNSIDSLLYRVFKNNKKLEVIDLQENKIKVLNLKLFLNMAMLQIVNFRNNECANNILYREDINEKSKDVLSKCYKNCMLPCYNYQQHPQSDVVVRPPPVFISCYKHMPLTYI